MDEEDDDFYGGGDSGAGHEQAYAQQDYEPGPEHMDVAEDHAPDDEEDDSDDVCSCQL